MFKKLVLNIIQSNDFDEAFNPVDMAFQADKIKWEDHQNLLALCEKIFKEEN